MKNGCSIPIGTGDLGEWIFIIHLSYWRDKNLIKLDTKYCEVVVRSGNMIPLDGMVLEGEAMVNQAALTGESMPVRKTTGATVYAGTVVEEGECVLVAKAEGGANRYDKIVAMIEESEKLKSGTENRALQLADRLVPCSTVFPSTCFAKLQEPPK